MTRSKSDVLKRLILLKPSLQDDYGIEHLWLFGSVARDDATETHIDLYQVLNRVPSARVQASFEKKLGLEFAKLRDRNLLALGQLYRDLGQDRKAVRPLVQLIQSQSRTELGLRAYKILQDMGFTEELSLTN